MSRIKIELPKADKDRIDRDLERHPIVKFLKQRDNYNFNVGDILIKKVKKWAGSHATDQTWEVETASPSSKVARKYIFVHENGYGVGYIKRLRADGSGPCGVMMCLADSDPSYTRFEVDPDFSDHLLLAAKDDKFTYNERFLQEKIVRAEILKKNRALLEKTKTEEDADRILRSLYIGQVVWLNKWDASILDLEDQEYKVSAISEQQSNNDPNRKRISVEFYDVGHLRKLTIMTPQDLKGKAISLTKPRSLKDTNE